jgi:hypothetical protein
VLDMQDTRITNRAKELGISTVSAVVIDGKLAECCTKRGVDESTLRVAGAPWPMMIWSKSQSSIRSTAVRMRRRSVTAVR